MAVATETEQFESVGYVKGITEGKFPQSFVAELNNGDKLYGSKIKKDQSPTKVWPLIRESFDQEKYFKWTGNLKPGEKGSFRQVTFGFEVDEGPGPQENYVAPEERVPPGHLTKDPNPSLISPSFIASSGEPERISSSDLPPEIAKPLEGAHKASQAMQNGRKPINTYVFGSVANVVAGLAQSGLLNDDDATSKAQALLFSWYEDALLMEQQQPQ